MAAWPHGQNAQHGILWVESPGKAHPLAVRDVETLTRTCANSASDTSIWPSSFGKSCDDEAIVRLQLSRLSVRLGLHFSAGLA
jgi:hypothetical protein